MTDDPTELDLRPGDRPGHFVVQAPRRGRVGGFLRGLAVGVLALVGLLFVASKLVSIDLNPFDAERTDRSQPTLLVSVRDLARFTAAEGTFQQVVDIETGRKYVPFDDDRTLFVAAGEVDAYVDFSSLDDDAIDVAADGSVTVTLPQPRLSKASLDLDHSYTYSEDQGLVSKVKDLFSDDPDQQADVYRTATGRIQDAADDADLTARAETNTRGFLTGLLGSLGYDDVTVTFAPDPT